MALIDISGLTFCYDGSYDTIFENISIQIDTAWRLGLVGRNGRGKTTLLHLLRGQYTYSGTISTTVSFDYFPFPVSNPDRYTAEILEEIVPEVAQWQLSKELSLLEVDDAVLWRPFSTLSGGEQSKVLLCALFLREGRFLLIDEPTNHLDLEGRRVVSDYLRKKQGFILISHDRAFLDDCVDHILAINKRDIQVQQGDFSAWWHTKEQRDNWERAENEKLRRDITRLDEAARRTLGWANQIEASKCGTRNSGLRPDRGYIGHKSAKMMKRAKAVEHRQQDAAEQASGLLKNIELAVPLKLHPLQHPKECLVELAGFAPDFGAGPVCDPITLILHRGERVALCGANGSGKSSLLRLLSGEVVPHTGTVHTASGLVLSYVPQHTDGLSGDLSAYAARCCIEESLFKSILRKLDFSRIQFEKDISDFSAGQKKKVLLARSLCQQAHLYLWDEPLNYIDLFSRLQIEALLREYRPTMLLVEHDRAFLDGVASRTITCIQAV